MTVIAKTEEFSSNNSKGAPKAYIEVDFDLCYVGKVYIYIIRNAQYFTTILTTDYYS